MNSLQKNQYLAASFSPIKLISNNKNVLSTSNPEFLQIYSHSPIQRLSITKDQPIEFKVTALSQENEEMTKKIIDKSQEAMFWKAKYQEGIQRCSIPLGAQDSQDLLIEYEKKIRLLIEENEYLKKSNLEINQEKPISLKNNAEFIEKVARLEEGINSVLIENDKLNAAMTYRIEVIEDFKRKTIENENRILLLQQENSRLEGIISEKDDEIFKLLEEKIYLKEQHLDERNGISTKEQKEIEILKKKLFEMGNIKEENENLKQKIKDFDFLREKFFQDLESKSRELRDANETIQNYIRLENEVRKGNEIIKQEREIFLKETQDLKEKLRFEQDKNISNNEKFAKILQEKTEKIKETFEKNRDLEKKLFLLLGENEKLNKIFEENNKNLIAYREKTQKMSQEALEMEVFKQDLIEAKSLIEEKEMKNVQKKEENDALKNKIQQIQTQLYEKQQNINEKQEIILKYEENFKDFKEKISNLSKENKELKEENEEDVKENDRLQKKLNELTLEKNIAKDRIEVLLKNQENFILSNKQLHNENQANELEYINKIKNLVCLNEDLNEVVEKTALMITSKEKTIHSIQSLYEQEKEAFLQEKSRKEEFIEKVNNLQEQLELNWKENNDLKTKIQILEKDLLQMLQINKTLLEKYNENQKEMEKYNNECRFLLQKTKELGFPSQDNKENSNENIFLQEKIQNLVTENKTLKAQILKTQEENYLSIFKTNSFHLNQNESKTEVPLKRNLVNEFSYTPENEDFQGNYEEINEYVERLRKQVRNLKNSSLKSKEKIARKEKMQEIQQIFMKLQNLKKTYNQNIEKDTKKLNLFYEEINEKIKDFEEKSRRVNTDF